MFSADLLMNIFGIIVAILVLSILVAVHEAGHLLIAKWSNIRVDIFSIGMGKPIWGFQYGETYYQIGRLPFGGYCGFGEEEKGEDSDPRSLMNSPLWARLLTVLGGSLFNIIFAFLVMLLMYGIGFKEYQLSNQVYVPQTISITPNTITNSPAYEAGIRSGDTIIAIDNTPVTHFMEIPTILSLSTTPSKTITYLRDTTSNTTSITPILNSETGGELLGVQPVKPAAISAVSVGSPAELAGLKEGDTITKINNIPVKFFYQLENIIAQGKPFTIDISRNNTSKTLSITPILKDNVWYIGVQSEYPSKIEVLEKGTSFGNTISLAYQNVADTIGQIGISLTKLFSGKVDVQKNLSGPVRIVSITGNIAKTFDFTLLIRFMVMLSIALATFNLLPFPGLDGGAIILQTARAIFKNNTKIEQIITRIEQFGILLLLTLAIFVLFNDVRNIAQENKATPSALDTD